LDEKTEIPFEKLSEEIAKRNESSVIPIQLYFYNKNSSGFTLIDSPNIGDAENEKIFDNIISQSNRLLFYVEETADIDSVKLPEFAKTKDPKMIRTKFVFTNLADQIAKLVSTKEANQFFSSITQLKSYFVTFLSADTKSQIDQTEDAFHQEYLTRAEKKRCDCLGKFEN